MGVATQTFLRKRQNLSCLEIATDLSWGLLHSVMFSLGLKVFSKLLRDGRFEAMMRQVIDEEKKAA